MGNVGRGIYSTHAGEGVEYSVASDDNDSEEKWVERARKTCSIGPDAEDSDHDGREESHRYVEKLRFSQRAAEKGVSELLLWSIRTDVCNLREIQIGDDGGQVEGQSCRAGRMKRPDQREQPNSVVSQSLYNLEVEIQLRGKRRV